MVDHVGSETWIITSASLVRKPGTEHGAYNSDDIKVKRTTVLLLVYYSDDLSPFLMWILCCKFVDCRSKWFCTISKMLKGP